MKKFVFIILSAFYGVWAYAGNPLTGKYKTPHETFPFSKIKNSDYIPAFKEGIEELNKEILAIINNPEAPTFENTIIAFERSGQLLERVKGAFFGILDVDNSDEKMQIAHDATKMISENEHDIYLDNRLFDRIKEVYDKMYELNLLTQDQRLLQKTYNKFCNRGAALSPSDKEKYRSLKNELNFLEVTFNQNILRDANRFELLLTGKDDIAGIPDDFASLAAQAAQEKGKDGWLFSLSDPSYTPFMTYATNRTLREKMYRAKMNIGNNDNEFDNKEIVRKIVNIRLSIAKLMGHENYASYALKNQMAESEENVSKLLQNLLNNYKPLAETEFNILQGYIMGYENLDSIKLMPWEWDYYANKLRDLHFKFNEEKTRPYFELGNVTRNVFELASQLFDIYFVENSKIQVYHPDVKAYEVYDGQKNLISVLYMDFFPRPTKASGGWMDNLQQQYIDAKGRDHRPHILIALNFNPPTETQPSLLTFSDVSTLLHEFGHALHAMFSECKYASLSGTNVQQDFAELPSQMMENWLRDETFLSKVAVHYQSGEKIPSDLVAKIINAANFHIGYACCRQVSFALLDMGWHTLTEPFEGDIEQFEKEIWAQGDILPLIPNTLVSTSLDHIFSSDEYAAGYYGYKWAEVLDADAFSAFQEAGAGVFSRAVADDFKNFILSKGDSEDPNKLYIRFRCKNPSIDALLQRNGLIPSIKNETITQ